MDSHLWHAQAIAPAPVRPTPLTPAQVSRLDDDQAQAYNDSVKGWLLRHIVSIPHLKQTLTRLSETVADNALLPPGAKNLLCIDGPNTVGKSTLARGWAQGKYRDWVASAPVGRDGFPELRPGGRIRSAAFTPVIWINLLADADVAQLDRQILDFVGINSSGPARGLPSLVVQAIADHGIKMLVVDDAHLLKTRRIKGRAVLDHLKHLNTELGEYGSSLVLVGANMAGTQITEDPQIKGRLRTFPLRPLRADDVAGMAQWQKQLLTFEAEYLPYVPRTEVGTLAQKYAALIWRRTQGHVGDVAELIRQATIAAVQSGTFRVTQAQLLSVPLSQRAQEAEAANKSSKLVGRAA